jgi:glutathione reductase (NADPH)
LTSSTPPTPTFRWAEFKAKRDAYIRRLNDIYSNNVKKDSIEYAAGYGKLLDARTVAVDAERFEARTSLSRPAARRRGRNDMPGAEHGISSDGFFELNERPARVAVVGAGYIAVELAGIFRGLGSETALYIRHKTFLAHV